MKPKALAIVAVVALVASACSSSSSSPTASSGASAGNTAVKIGVELPLSGGEAPNGGPTLNGIKLAIKQIQVPGYTVTLNTQDDAVNGVNNPDQGAKNIGTLVSDKSVFAVVGPFNSAVAKAEIPISNEAGLIQCSPANTNSTLTLGDTAKQLRQAHPDQIAYVRVVANDDYQGLADATIAYKDLSKKAMYIVDDQTTYGKYLADVVEAQFKKLGGTVVKHDGAGTNVSDYTSLLTAAKALNPDVVFYGGVTSTGGGVLRKQMVANGMGALPFIGGDGISDGAASVASSFLNIAGDQGDVGTWMTVAGAHDIPDRATLAAAYKTEFGAELGAYSAAAYACTQVYLQALKAVGPDREKIRAYVTTTSNSFDTVLGKIGFDANGDINQHIISYFQFDPTTKDWKFVRQNDPTAA
jgi:branched-chain amino acid transport system substrate-binding protein